MAYLDTPLFALENWLDAAAATVTSADEQAAFPAANLREEDPSLAFRTDNVTGTKSVTYDLGQTRALDLYAMPISNATEASTHTLYGSANGTDWDEITGTWGGLKDDRKGEPRNCLLFLAAATASYRYFRHDAADAANPDGFLEAARAVLAAVFQTAIAQEYGSYEVGVQPTDTVNRTPGGAQHAYAGGRPHVVQLEYEWLDEDEALENFVEELDYALGLAGRLVLVLEPNDSANWWRQVFWCFTSEASSASPPGWNHWKKTYTFEEVVP